VRDLPARWRAEAASLEQYGALGNAVALRSVADQLEAAIGAADATPLTLAQASAASRIQRRSSGPPAPPPQDPERWATARAAYPRSRPTGAKIAQLREQARTL